MKAFATAFILFSFAAVMCLACQTNQKQTEVELRLRAPAQSCAVVSYKRKGRSAFRVYACDGSEFCLKIITKNIFFPQLMVPAFFLHMREHVLHLFFFSHLILKG